MIVFFFLVIDGSKKHIHFVKILILRVCMFLKIAITSLESFGILK